MFQIERNIYLPYTREQLYGLVSDIASYPAFIPYCLESTINSTHDGVVEGSLRIGYKGLGYTFATRNINHPPHHIRMELLSGPFRQLKGEWQFDEHPTGCHVRLQLSIVFKNALLGVMFKNKINEITDMMVTAFEQRARDLYK